MLQDHPGTQLLAVQYCLRKIIDIPSRYVGHGQRSRDSPGSRPSFLQSTTKVHIKDPNNILDRHAASIEDDAVNINLEMNCKGAGGTT